MLESSVNDDLSFTGTKLFVGNILHLDLCTRTSSNCCQWIIPINMHTVYFMHLFFLLGS